MDNALTVSMRYSSEDIHHQLSSPRESKKGAASFIFNTTVENNTLGPGLL
jgi:hypothetical protein